jgi:DNA-binding MarR family transcriptional regulator
MNVLELFCGTKSFTKVAEARGHECRTLDMDPSFEPTICKDIMDLSYDDLGEFKPDIIWASPPCESFSVNTIGRNWNRDYTPKPQKVGGLASTSLESYKLLTEDLLAKEHSTIVMALLTKGPMSNRKIAEETGIVISSVTARVYELREDGFVREHFRQKDPDTRKTVIVWELVNPISLENWNRSAIIEKVTSS